MSSFDDYIQMQEQLNQQLNALVSPLVYSCPDFSDTVAQLNEMDYSPIREWEELYARTIAPIQETLDNLTNGFATSIAAAIQNPAILAASFQEIIPLDILQNFENLNTLPIEQFGKAFDPVFSAIDNIRIFSDYIEIPEELIPEKLFPEAISSENIPVNMPAKKLSRDQALTIISILLTIMFWILNNTSPASWQQKYHDEIVQSLEKQNNLLEESNQLQKNQNDLLEESNQIQAERAQLEKEQLQATEEQTQVLKAIAHLLGIQNSLLSQEAVAPSESPAADSKATDVDPGSLAVDSKAATAEAESFPADEPHPIPD